MKLREVDEATEKLSDKFEKMNLSEASLPQVAKPLREEFNLPIKKAHYVAKLIINLEQSNA